MTTDNTAEAEAAAAPAPALQPVGGILLDAWVTAIDFGVEMSMPTRVSMVSGAGHGEAFAVIEQAPDARIFLGEDEIQRVIAALSVALAAMRGFNPQQAVRRWRRHDEGRSQSPNRQRVRRRNG